MKLVAVGKLVTCQYFDKINAFMFTCSATVTSKQHAVSNTNLMTVRDVCLPHGRSEHLSRGNLSAVVNGVGNLERCRKKVLPLLHRSVCKYNVSSAPATNCVSSEFQRPSVSFTNSKFYAFSEFYYTMEDILKIGGKYNSVRFQIAAQVIYIALQVVIGVVAGHSGKLSLPLNFLLKYKISADNFSFWGNLLAKLNF